LIAAHASLARSQAELEAVHALHAAEVALAMGGEVI
jgi:hypothetical protein